MNPEYQSLNFVGVSKSVFVMVNSVEGLRLFIDYSLPLRSRSQAGVWELHVASRPTCVSVHTISWGLLSLILS